MTQQEFDKEVRIEELKKVEKMTHNGRGTILWEMDEMALRINERLAALTPKKEEQ